MRVSDFDFHLPDHLIAQTPLAVRSQSKLMVLDPTSQSISHKQFFNVLDYLHEGDVLVRNNTRVIPARLFGTKESTMAHVEVLLLRELGNHVWECLIGNARVIKLGTTITFGDGRLRAECVEVLDQGIRHLRMIHQGIFMEILDQLGQVPLPPYIKATLEDPERYQTVYAAVKGSAAAPTAGLHFTEELFQQIRNKGIEIRDVTLHIGLGTFRPVNVDTIEEHVMHEEYYSVDEPTAYALNKAKKEGRRIIAIGTTSTRVLESLLQTNDTFFAGSRSTAIFIYPGFKFKAIDGLITNFHLPQSTLLMLVSALAGQAFILKAYEEAVNHNYRFFSFGDSMFILPRN